MAHAGGVTRADEPVLITTAPPNPVEERLLAQHAYRQRLAHGLVRAIEDYFAVHAAQ